jgi:hypothetical protein
MKQEQLTEEIKQAKTKRWVENHRSLPYADYECKGSYPDLPFSRLTFDFSDRTACAVRGNPAATDDNFEEAHLDGPDSTVKLTWEQAVEIVGGEPDPAAKDHVKLVW